jgi:Na+/alanine symporter
MYVIREGLGRKWLPLAWMFAIAGMVGTLPVFQINQLVQILRDLIAIPAGLATSEQHFSFDLVAGIVLAGLIFSIAVGKIKRISAVAAKTNEPAREGLVAMMGPVLDTLVVCTCTALALLVTDAWRGDAVGVTMTAQAYEQAFPGIGSYLLLLMVFVLSTTTVLTYWYYGSKCMGFLFGAAREKYYMWAYMALITVGAVASMEAVINLLDGMYATMAIPTMLSTLLLAPRVRIAARDYFRRLDAGEFEHQMQTPKVSEVPK